MVIHAVLKITDTAMGVSQRPAGKKCFTFIRDIIAVGVFEELGHISILNDKTSVGKCHRGRDAKTCCKHRKSVRASVSIGILENPNPIPTFSFGLQLIRVVLCFSDPQASTGVPVHADRFSANVRL